MGVALWRETDSDGLSDESMLIVEETPSDPPPREDGAALVDEDETAVGAAVSETVDCEDVLSDMYLTHYTTTGSVAYSVACTHMHHLSLSLSLSLCVPLSLSLSLFLFLSLYVFVSLSLSLLLVTLTGVIETRMRLKRYTTY